MHTHITGAELAKDATALRAQLITLKSELPTLRARIIELDTQATITAIRASVTPDRQVIQAITAIDELDKTASTLAKRVRDWYALYDPETEHALRDHAVFLEQAIKLSRLQETMGGTFAPQDLDALRSQASAALALYQQRARLLTYLDAQMQAVMPNVTHITGATIGARLLMIAGSLERLSSLPSGTVQLLGAETALFRHLRNKRSRPPKHGIIFNHQILQRASRERRGKAARALADAISIAARIDYFKGEFQGDVLLKKVEAKLR